MFGLRAIIQTPASAGSLRLSALLANKTTEYQQSRPLSRQAKDEHKKFYRWPYEKYAWNLFSMWADLFTKRKFNENTKLIVVDGNVEAGKDVVARRLAQEFGLLYLEPELDLDTLYVNEHGFDYRALNPQLPERLRVCDYEMWHENPSRLSVQHLQHFLCRQRMFQYIKALRHMFNTGQGVVLNRSAFSDRTFVEAMHNLGWLPKGYLRGDGVRFYDWRVRYNAVRNFVLSDLPKPHLIVYVDTPVDVCLDRIANDPNPVVRNSKALRKEFLEEIETAYKDLILPKSENFGHICYVSGAEQLNDDDYVDLIDEIEAMDFEFDEQDTRFLDWDSSSHASWYVERRRTYTTSLLMGKLKAIATMPYYDIAGLGDVITRADLILRETLIECHVANLGWKYRYNNDPNIHGWLKSCLGWEDFEARIDKYRRADFV